jgi:hypothetical protein
MRARRPEEEQGNQSGRVTMRAGRPEEEQGNQSGALIPTA